MRLIPGEANSLPVELDRRNDVEDLRDLWNLLESANKPCCLIPKTDEEGDYFELLHPYDW